MPQGSGFRTFFVPGGGAFALSKKFPGVSRGGGRVVRLGIADTLQGSAVFALEYHGIVILDDIRIQNIS